MSLSYNFQVYSTSRIWRVDMLNNESPVVCHLMYGFVGNFRQFLHKEKKPVPVEHYRYGDKGLTVLAKSGRISLTVCHKLNHSCTKSA